jgi:hypothetical protein
MVKVCLALPMIRQAEALAGLPDMCGIKRWRFLLVGLIS